MAPSRATPPSIQRQLLGWLLGGFALVWVVTAITTWRDVRGELDELLDAHLAQAAAILVVQQSAEPEHEGDGDGDHERTLDAPALHRYAPRTVFQVYHEGRPALRSAQAPLRPLGPLEGPAVDGYFEARDDEGRRWRVFSTIGPARDVRVFVGERLDARQAILREALVHALAPITIALPLLLAACAWAVRRATAPLRTLQHQLQHRAPDSAEPMVMHDAPSELAPVVDALNRLLARIGAMLESERRFIADAAHELRTPVAAIAVQAEVAQAEADAQQRAHALRAVRTGAQRAAHLVDQMLTLSRLEAGAPMKQAPVDVDAAVRRVVGDLAPQALQLRQDISVEGEAGWTLPGDATLMEILLRNLVDNAIRHGGAKATVRVTLGRDAAGPWLTVDDSGPGLAPDAMARLGERFHRGPDATASGSGLGWSIVRRVAQAQGLRVEPRPSEALGGLSVRVAPAA